MLQNIKYDPDMAAVHAVKIKRQEYDAAERLLQNHQRGLSIDDLGEFASETYHRVQDMFTLTDFITSRQLVMVGCGPFPATALHIAHRFPQISITALDTDRDSINMCQKIVNALGYGDSIMPIHCSGTAYDYCNAEIAYIANLVRPKSEVLARIAATININSLAVLRDPTHRGLAVAECGLLVLRDQWKIEGMGQENDRFSSKNVFLRRC